MEPWEPNVTALLDPASLKRRDLATPDTPIPTPWPKDAFERDTKAVQEKRRAIRAANRPVYVVCRRAIAQIIDLYAR